MSLTSSGGSFGSPNREEGFWHWERYSGPRDPAARKFCLANNLSPDSVTFSNADSYFLVLQNILVQATCGSGKRKRNGVFLPAKRVYMTNPFPDVGHWRLTQIQIKVTSLRSVQTISATYGGSMSQVRFRPFKSYYLGKD